jgi:hypothetical protein
MSAQVVYIDADIIWHATGIDKRLCEREIGHDNIEHLISASRDIHSIIKIPQVTLAESFLNCLVGETSLSELEALLKRLKRELGDQVDFESPTKAIYEKAFSLSSRDEYLTGNDALFISHAFCNPDTNIVLTTEQIFTTSRVLLNERNQHPCQPDIRATYVKRESSRRKR